MQQEKEISCGSGKKVVCVTGASGLIASWLVKVLLQNGYVVKATVRNLGDPSKIEHLTALEGADERLHLFEANLTEEGSFDAAVYGCDGVFHTASPVILHSVNNPQEELIKPAVNGTLNVLRSCIKVPSIKRVVLTSSMGAVGANKNPKFNNVVIDETWFSDPSYCEDSEQWYCLSKTLAEENAMKFAEEHDIDILVINPGLVIGPSLLPTLNVASMGFLDFLENGSSSVCSGGLAVIVDIRDVCDAHILAFENPTSKGRYCLVAGLLQHSEVLNILRDFYPTLNLPMSSRENEPVNSPLFQITKEKAKTLGVKFIPMEQSIKDTIESLKDKNLDFHIQCPLMSKTRPYFLFSHN